MIRKDLIAAGVEPEQLGKRCDFHALRVTMVSQLALNGVPLAIAQKLARHSTPVLTANTYTQLGMGELKQAVESLPALGNDDNVLDEGDEAGRENAAGDQ
jgi:integrase